MKKIERHLFENKNHTVRTEYRCYKDEFTYDVKTLSQLTKTEKEMEKITVYHF